MNSLFPLIYSITLFFFLSLISFFIVKQIINNQKLENKIFELQETIKNSLPCGEAYYKLGQLYLKKKLFSKAIVLFRKALKNWDTNDKIGLGSLCNTIGFTYFNLEEYNLAIYYYEIANKVLPDYILALTNLGYAYEKKNLLSNSYNSYKKALFYDTENNLASKRIKIVSKLLTLKNIK